MDIETAFLTSSADDLFSSVAAFGDARTLEIFDVPNAQKAARQAISAAIDNALNPRSHNPGSRLALIKGEAGSGKSHVLTVAFKRAAATQETYPAILQLTAPVRREDYESWLLDATIRQLSARHFADDDNQSPLRRLAGRLLERLEIADREQFLRVIEDSDDDEDVLLSLQLAEQILEGAEERLDESPPLPGFVAVLLLAGFGDSAALSYLRHGRIRRRLEELELDELPTPTDRLGVLVNLGLAAQIVGASLTLGFDQVENTVRLGSEGLFVHTITQAVRLAETIINCLSLLSLWPMSMTISSLADVTREVFRSPIATASNANRQCPSVLSKPTLTFFARSLCKDLVRYANALICRRSLARLIRYRVGL
jgi:hypothetical protein